MARKVITLKIGSYLTSLTIIVAVIESILRFDLMYGLAIIFEGVVMTLAVILSIIPIVNLYVLFNLQVFTAGMFTSWGLEIGLGSAIVFAPSFLTIIFITAIVDIVVAVVVWNYLIGNKRYAAQMMNKFSRMISM